MISTLFRLYRASPFWLRDPISRATWPLRFAMKPFSAIDVGGYKMFLDYMDNASFKYHTDRERYELTEVTAFLSAIANNPPAVVIDVGANYGAFTLAAGSLAKLGVIEHIFAIEPDRRPFQALGKSIRKNGLEAHVTALQMIAGDQPGRETIFVNARSSADNRTHKVTSSPIRVRDSYEVECATVDDIMRREGIEGGKPIVVKMDIQGNEARALTGMKQTLESASAWVLFFEHCPYLVDSAGIDLAEFEDSLVAMGADSMFEISGGSVVPLPDAEALRASFKQLVTDDETRMEGTGSNYIFVKGARFPAQGSA